MALRTARQVPSLWFGRPGKLISLPWPKGGVESAYERQTYDFLSGSGMHQVSSLVVGSRPYTINWESMHVDTFNKLSQFRIGANGPGPWTLIDPASPNLLPANVGSATGLYADATDLISAGGTGGTGGSNANSSFIHRTAGYRSIKWTFTTAPIVTNPTLGISPLYRNWFGHPVVPSTPYVFSSWCRVDGVIETSATMSIRMRWLDAAGAVLSESTSGDLAVTSTWQRLSVSASSPAGAVYVEPRWVALGSSLTVNGIIYIDEPLLEQDSIVNDWAPSSGIRPVDILELGEGVPFDARFRTGTTMTVRELAR